MSRRFLLLVLLTTLPGLRAAEPLPIERQVEAIVAGPQVTVVHFWAPWCANCAIELSKNGWSGFIGRNPKVSFVFITVWHGGDTNGRATLAKYGVGEQKNFQLLHHPNGSRRDEEKMTSFLGLPMTAVPSTWVFRGGRLRYALNHGEVRFPMLQQLVEDAAESWER